MNIIIRNAILDDAKQIQAVARDSWTSTYEGIIPSDIQAMFLNRAYSDESMVRRIERTVLLVAQHDEKIIAFANFTKVKEDGNVELIALYILSDYQRLGIGTHLLKKGISQLDGVKALYLDVNSHNMIGKSFYLSYGFKVVEEYEDEIFGFREKLTKMMLTV